MKDVYVITMWSGGRPAKKWKSLEEPTVLPNGMGVAFVSVDTKLHVKVIGSISVEQFESGKEEIEAVRPEAAVETIESIEMPRGRPRTAEEDRLY